MKDTLNYYYNLNILEVENWGEDYRFQIGNDTFYFVVLRRTEAEINDIMEITYELKRKNILVHDIIVNRFNKVVTNAYNQNYVLLHPLGKQNEEVSLNEMFKLNDILILSPVKSRLYRNAWAELWSDKIDYFEYQVHELGKEKDVVLNSFSYYVGLGENAISYVNNTIENYQPSSLDRVCLAHRRIKFPNYQLNYYNPLSFIFDLEVRDIAEYIKSAFFEGEDALSYLRIALKQRRYTLYSLSLLYARLIYPTYYFDLYEAIMNKKEEEEKLVPIIEKAQDYEIFLKEAYLEIRKYGNIEVIEWIMKKEL